MSIMRPRRQGSLTWLRTNGVNANGAAAKVMNFDRLRKQTLFLRLDCDPMCGAGRREVLRCPPSEGPPPCEPRAALREGSLGRGCPGEGCLGRVKLPGGSVWNAAWDLCGTRLATACGTVWEAPWGPSGSLSGAPWAGLQLWPIFVCTVAFHTEFL